MKASALGWALSLAASVSAASDTNTSSLIVKEAPNFVRPYVLPKYKGKAVKLTSSGQIIRFSITANSSDGAFSLVQHNGRVTTWTPARPHTHQITHEHFYSARGRSELWAKKNVTGAVDKARPTDPDSQLSHIFHPGGFEHLFELVWSDPAPFGPLKPGEAERFATLDLYAIDAVDYVPRRDFVNGTAGDPDTPWHNGNNTLPDSDTEPYFVARDYGPKFLNSENGYKVIQPLMTPTQATHGNFTLGTIIMSEKLDNETASVATLPHHFALQMEDGQLVLELHGYKKAYLLPGDVAFVPANTTFKYTATVPFTKFLYMNGGAKGLEYQLLKKSVSWDFPAYPA
ncbi:Quercetin 2,3-dioxygenase [Cladobotryum mycophilum]|uniref:Quercetin 2,3-dioxygenase n=1 Tax=Cladobotryum mycophilum TaxID=491253 RepID=A0ABR0SX36_9HYPO